MSEVWERKPLASYLEQTFAGEWGVDPDPMNCVVYRSTDVDDVGTIRGHGAERRVEASKLLQKQLKEGDILLEASGGSPDKPVGRTAIVEGKQASVPATCSNFFRVLRPSRTKADPSFLNHKLVWRYRQPEMLVFQQQTTGIINLNFKDFLAASIEMPECLISQSKIAEVLDTLDAAIRGTEAVVAKLRAMKQGLLHDLLTRGIDANGDLRPPQPEAPHLYQQTPLGWLPEEWGIVTVKDLARSSVIGPFGSDLVASDYRDEGVPVVFVRDIKPDVFAWKSNVFLHERKALALAAHLVTAGDVVATKMGFPPCIAAVYPNEMPDGIITADVVCIRPNLGIVRPAWLSTSMNSPRVQRQVDQITAGVTRPKVTLRDVRELKVAMPNLEEQSAIIQRLSAIDEEIRMNNGTLDKLRLQKSGLMDDLLTGRVPVTPLL